MLSFTMLFKLNFQGFQEYVFVGNLGKEKLPLVLLYARIYTGLRMFQINKNITKF